MIQATTFGRSSSSFQRLSIRVLLGDLDMGTDRFAAAHLAPFAAAGLALPVLGTEIVGHLRSLSKQEAYQLIKALIEARNGEVAHAR